MSFPIPTVSAPAAPVMMHSAAHQPLSMMAARPSSLAALPKFSLQTPPGIPGIPPIETAQKSYGAEQISGQKASPVSFSNILESMAKNTRDNLNTWENIGRAAAAGQMDPQHVATTVVQAKATVSQFSALVQAATTAYQELMRISL